MKRSRSAPQYACASVLAMVILLVATTANAIVLDTFDSPTPSSVFPLFDEPGGLSPSGEEVFDNELGTIARIAFLAAGYDLPLPNPLPQGQSVTVSNDQGSGGVLTSTATAEASTLLLLGWVRGIEGQELNLDLSGQNFFEFDYSSNKDTYSRIVLSNGLANDIERASQLDFVIPAGSGTWRIHLDAINEITLGNPRLENGMIVRDPLPPVDLASVDVISMSIGTTDSPTVPLGLEFELSEIGFAVPEPVSALLLLVSSAMMLSFRYRLWRVNS